MAEQYSVQQIEEKIRKWTADNISEDFEFRPGQFEAIRGTIYSIINSDLDTNILQAPTGTGKSFICIISAGVLAYYYNKKSYILASDLYLWKQYADAIDQYKLKDFGYMKGSLGNYTCNINFSSYEEGLCKQKHVSLGKFRHKDPDTMAKYPCADTCQYLCSRFRAEKTPVTLMTYQLWLYQMNLVKAEPGEGFNTRDVIFCDECHNIPDLISRFAQPKVSPYDLNRILTITDYVKKHNIELPWVPRFFTTELRERVRKSNSSDFKNLHIGAASNLDDRRIIRGFHYCTDAMEIAVRELPVRSKATIKTDVLEEFLKYLWDINKLAEAASEFSKKQSSEYKSPKEMSTQELRRLRRAKRRETSNQEELDAFDRDLLSGKSDKDEEGAEMSMFRLFDWFHNYLSSFDQYLAAVISAGQQYIIIEKTEDDNKRATYTFFCVKEDYLCKKYLLDNAKNKVMTSATVGNIASFMTNIGIDLNKVSSGNNLTEDSRKYVAYTTLPNIFDFGSSPIFYLPDYKMNFKDKNTSFPKIQDIVYKILDTYPDVRGMINTGSYINSQAIINNAPKHLKDRLISYDSSKNKNKSIERFRATKNGIMVGPTLVEGVDLPGDLCRLIIIVKLPYPNISSPLTKSKMNLFPLWYSSTTSNTVIQNIGRGVRFQGDWCFTFILDGCFDGLYAQTHTQYAPEIQQRFIRITPEFITGNTKEK